MTPSELTADPLQSKVEDYERSIRSLQSRIEELEQDRRKLSALVDFTDAGLLVFNSSLKLTWFSEVFAQRFLPGGSSEGLLGSSCHRVLCRREKICDSCPSLQPFTTGAAAHGEFLTEID